MKKVLEKIILTILLVKLFNKKENFSSEINLIDSDQAKKYIKNNYFKKIIDVRTEEEWNKGHHPSAIHIPIEPIDMLTESKIKKLEGPVLIYCRSGRRALNAAKKIKNSNNIQIYYINKTYKSLI